MIDVIKNAFLNVLRVPPEPSPPAGAPESIRIFRAARNFYYLKLIRWGMGQSVALGALVFVFALGFFVELGPAASPFRVIKGILLGIFLLQVWISYLMIRLDYELRWYIVTDRSLRIRHGLVYVREMTMTFANIQQISIRQGPLQRVLGIADLEVRTAGGGSNDAAGHSAGNGGTGNSMHLGYFHGVTNAPEIRDLMLDRLRQWRDAGLGDPDDTPIHESAPAQLPAPGTQLMDAAQSILAAAQALRKAVS